MDFTTHKDRYEEQLKSKEEQRNMDSEDIVKNVFGDSLTVEHYSKCAVFDFS